VDIEDPDPTLMEVWCDMLTDIRMATKFRNFTLDDEVLEDYKTKLDKDRKYGWKNPHDLLASASARNCSNALKIALHFAITSNPIEEDVIQRPAWDAAWIIAEYLADVKHIRLPQHWTNTRKRKEKLLKDIQRKAPKRSRPKPTPTPS